MRGLGWIHLLACARLLSAIFQILHDSFDRSRAWRHGLCRLTGESRRIQMVYAGQPELYAKMQGLMVCIPPGPQINMPAQVFCVSWDVDLEFRVTQVTCATAAHSGQVVPTDGTDPCRAVS